MMTANKLRSYDLYKTNEFDKICNAYIFVRLDRFEQKKSMSGLVDGWICDIYRHGIRGGRFWYTNNQLNSFQKVDKNN